MHFYRRTGIATNR